MKPMKLSEMIEEMKRLLRSGDCEVKIHLPSGVQSSATWGEAADGNRKRIVLIDV